MRRCIIGLILAAASLSLGGWLAMRLLAPVKLAPQSTPQPSHDQLVAPQTGRATEHAEARLRDLIAAANGPRGAYGIPKGTRLLSYRAEGDTAIVDLSADFATINNRSDTAESLAQGALLRAVAASPGIRKLRVLVVGKPFEGEHSGEWSDLPVSAKESPGILNQ